MVRLTVIGGGKMGEALVGGLVASGWATAGELVVVEPLERRREELGGRHPGLRVVPPALAVDDAATADVLIAVKPDHVRDVCTALGASPGRRLLSIVAGVGLASLEAWSPPDTHVLRAMPNTPALVGAGMAAVAGGSSADDADLAWATQILASVGEVVVCDEVDLDAVTGLSGSGPAYVFAFAEALSAAGVAAGLAPAIADKLTRQTLLGASRLLVESGEDPAVLRSNVTSPGGTTAAGLEVFASRGFAELVRDVVDAATKRSVELGATDS